MESQLVDGNDDMGVSGDVGLSTCEIKNFNFLNILINGGLN